MIWLMLRYNHVMSLKVVVPNLAKIMVYVLEMTYAAVLIHSRDLFATVLELVVNTSQPGLLVRSYGLVIAWEAGCIGSNHMVNLYQL